MSQLSHMQPAISSAACCLDAKHTWYVVIYYANGCCPSQAPDKANSSDSRLGHVQRVMQEKGWDIDARLMLYAAGLQHYGQYLEHGQRLVAASSTLPIAVDNRYKASKIPAPPTGNTDNTNEGLHSSLSAAGAADDESRARVMLDQGEGDGEMTRALWWAAFAGAVLGAGSVLVAQQAFRAS